MKVQNKVIIVTGGGSGMGRELVLNLLSKGAKVIAVDINDITLMETKGLAASNSSSLWTYNVNISDRLSVEQFCVEVIAKHTFIDGIINNAGIIQPFVHLNELSYDVIARVMDVNFFGALYMIKTFLPHLLTRPEAHIINISSMGGFIPFPGQTIYGASKAAVKLLTEGLNSELLNTNVRTTVVFPGAVQTNIMENSGLVSKPQSSGKSRTGMLLSSTEAADTIISAIERNKSRVNVGKDSKFLDAFYRISPLKAANFIFKKMQNR